MLFKRRVKQPVHKKVLAFLWPSSGFRRSLSYLRHRVARLPGSSHSIAAGFACGVAVSLTPFMGFHFVLAAFLAWVIGGNLFASALGTAVGNPWTFPVIWVMTYRLGCWILGMNAVSDPLAHMHLMQIFQNPLQSLGPLLVPMLVGSVPAAIMVWWASYWPVRKVIGKYRRRRMEIQHKRALELLEQRGTLKDVDN